MRLKIKLVLAESDLPQNDPSIQKEYQDFSSTMRDAGVKFSQRAIAFDGGAGLGHPLGDFILEFTGLLLPALKVAVAGWFYARKGRKVRMEIDGVVLEASSIEELERLADVYNSIRDGRPHDPDTSRKGDDPDSRRQR